MSNSPHNILIAAWVEKLVYIINQYNAFKLLI